MKLLTAQDTAVVLRITPHRVYQMAKEGLLPTIRVGRCLRFDEIRLEAWLDQGGFALRPIGEAGEKGGQPATTTHDS